MSLPSDPSAVAPAPPAPPGDPPVPPGAGVVVTSPSLPLAEGAPPEPPPPPFEASVPEMLTVVASMSNEIHPSHRPPAFWPFVPPKLPPPPPTLT